MYIKKESLHNGYNEYINQNSHIGRLALMDVGVLILDAGESYEIIDTEKEIATVLVEGHVIFSWNGKSVEAHRKNIFDYKGWCMHQPRNMKCTVKALERSELFIQKTDNNNVFEPKLYAPEDVQVQKAGLHELNGTMRRNICTYFDYENAPYSNMVIGEVINLPGRWSSYPPHWHPQPEVYYYRFDKPQGFGAGFTNGNIYQTGDHGLLLITDDFHSQVAAPGYAMYYIWGIRHLDGNPWKKTRIDCEEHVWMLDKDAVIWSGDNL